MRYRAILIALLPLLLGACSLGASTDRDDTEVTPIGTATAAGSPQVVINSPRNADEFVVNDPLFVETTITDSVGITSVQLLANGQPVKTVGIESVTNTFAQPVLDYTPRTTGNVTLSVVAYRGNVQSDPATVQVNIRDTRAQVTATSVPGDNRPIINPSDPNCRALINTGLNLRQGPSTTFNVIRVLGAGEVLPAVGRLANNTWWQLLDRNGARGWVSAEFITMYDGVSTLCRNIPVVAPPATATPQATATLPPTQTPLPTQTLVPTAVPTATSIPLPNLSIPAVFCPQQALTIPGGGTQVVGQFNLNITNTGGPVNQQFSVIARVVNGPTVDVGTFGNLNAGQIINAEVSIPLQQTGEIAIFFVVDSEDDIQESDESNNERSCIVTVVQG